MAPRTDGRHGSRMGHFEVLAALKSPKQEPGFHSRARCERWRFHLSAQPDQRLIPRRHFRTVCQNGHARKVEPSSPLNLAYFLPFRSCLAAVVEYHGRGVVGRRLETRLGLNRRVLLCDSHTSITTPAIAQPTALSRATIVAFHFRTPCNGAGQLSVAAVSRRRSPYGLPLAPAAECRYVGRTEVRPWDSSEFGARAVLAASAAIRT